jgi:hypothetical protein
LRRLSNTGWLRAPTQTRCAHFFAIGSFPSLRSHTYCTYTTIAITRQERNLWIDEWTNERDGHTSFALVKLCLSCIGAKTFFGYNRRNHF